MALYDFHFLCDSVKGLKSQKGVGFSVREASANRDRTICRGPIPVPEQHLINATRHLCGKEVNRTWADTENYR